MDSVRIGKSDDGIIRHGKVYWSECTQGPACHEGNEKTPCKTRVIIKFINASFTYIFAKYRESVTILENKAGLSSMFCWWRPCSI